MLRLEFTGQSVDAPLLSETARRFNVNNNIISAQMDYAGGVKFGIMLTEMHGTQQDTQAAIAWLQEHHVKVEVLGYVSDDVAAGSWRMGNAGNDLRIRIFWVCDWSAGWCLALYMLRVRQIIANAKAGSYRFCDCEHFPFHPVHYLAGMDDCLPALLSVHRLVCRQQLFR